MTWSTGRTRTWARPLSACWPRADSFTPASCPSTPVSGAWLVSGSMSAYRKSGAAQIAHAALTVATERPELVYRNPERVEQGWTQMREDRAAFVEFFGGDELVLPPAESEERLNAYYRHRQEAALARQPSRRRPPNLPG